MSRILGYTPSWLSRPSPGAKIFSDPEPQSPVSPLKRTSYLQNQDGSSSISSGAKRTIASRGTEIFTVVGNKIRWANLSKVQIEWEEQTSGRKHQRVSEPYRTLTVPVYYQITQLLISPSGTFLAICTEHTVHIAVLPDHSRLADNDTSPLKLKTYQLGPTIHVIPEPSLASVLWHPLAPSTNTTDCLVTVTIESAVRVWEIDSANHWSFERPALAVDLRKLADGVSADEDFEPSGFGKNRGFSVDSVDMEASAACFGGRGQADEDGWASMTLWVAMSNGDVYALCPLLPSRWRPTTSTIPALSISAVSKMSIIDSQTSEADEKKVATQQLEWVQEIDNGETMTYDVNESEIRSRPQNPSAIPRLQGPFELPQSEDFEENLVTDIHVIAARLDEETILSGEDDFETGTDGMQFTTICISSTSGQLYVTIELEGVSGQWLPKKGRSTFSVPASDPRELVLLDKVALQDKSSAQVTTWPAISADVNDEYRFYITSGNHVANVSLSDWAYRIGAEFGGEDEVDAGLPTRLSVACQDSICVTQNLFTADARSSASISPLSVPTQIIDINTGHMLLSSADGQAWAVLFDGYYSDVSASYSMRDSFLASTRSTGGLARMLEDEIPDPVPTRAPYVPASVFYQNQMQPFDELRQTVPPGRRSIMTENPLRLSPACLDIMTMAHRTFSIQTSNIEKAAAELFRNCERLREEIADQVKQMSELADRLQQLTPTATKDDGKEKNFVERLSGAQAKQKLLLQRYEALRRKSGRVTTSNQELSIKEQAWIKEIETLARKVGVDDDASDKMQVNTVTDRYEVVQSLVKELVGQSKQLCDALTDSPRKQEISRMDSSPSGRSSLSSRMHREKVAEVMAMVERESAIIDAVMNRLSKLNVG